MLSLKVEKLLGTADPLGLGVTEVPEIRLWRAVINRAAQDALEIDSDVRKVKVRNRKAAVWFNGGPDYREVCGFAGVNPDEVRRRYLVLHGHVAEAALCA